MKGLIIAGGQSSRMKSDKAMLARDGQPQYLRLASLLREVLESSVFISTRKSASYLDNLELHHLIPLFDTEPSVGPASGLLAAHQADRDSDWLVVACDFPLVETETIRLLLEVHNTYNSKNQITCYGHEGGTPEPLLAIWSSSALIKLDENVKRGLQGPLATLKQCHFIEVGAKNKNWLFNANTPEDWEKADGFK